MEDAVREPLLPPPAIDWLGRPAHARLGGWNCASCILGTVGLANLAFYGILFNLVLFLVQNGETNAAAATTVATISGTLFLCSFLGAFLSDAFMGRLWTTLIFQVLSTQSFIMLGVSVIMVSATGSSSLFLLMSLYTTAITMGPVMPNILGLGLDQLDSEEEKEKYFQLLAIAAAVGQLLAATVVTYLDNWGLWVWGAGVCTATSLGSLTMLAGGLRWFRQRRASGNPFLRNCQVLVAALRKYRIDVPKDYRLLHEYEGDISAIPGCCKLPHTCTLSFLDKAAVLEVADTSSRWRLCTVTQVEELKSFLRVIPAGMAGLFVTIAVIQIGTLFEEQAVLMNRQFGTWFIAPPASLHVLLIGSGILTGLVATACGGARPFQWCFGRIKQIHTQRANSLFLLGIALTCCISAMVMSALVESHRLYMAHRGNIISILWLVPQTMLLGVATNLTMSSSFDFFFSEVSESMRSVGGCIIFVFCGAGGYLNSFLVAVVTTITTHDGWPGWIANNLDEGHADYFYWFLASCLAFGLCFHMIYARVYEYTCTTAMNEHDIQVTYLSHLRDLIIRSIYCDHQCCSTRIVHACVRSRSVRSP